MSQTVQIPFVRQEGLKGVSTAAVLSLRIASDAVDQGEALSRLRRAITTWVSSTESGAAAWWASCEDFNIGDLSLHSDSKSLQHCLKAENIDDLSVITMDADQVEDFDLVLPDEPFEEGD